MRRRRWPRLLQLLTVLLWSLFPPFFTPASWQPDPATGLPVWTGSPADEPQDGPDLGDADADGLPNWFEDWLGSDRHNPDSDYDGLSDHDEPPSSDTDGDGLSDGEEVQYGTNPNNRDTDQDGLTDFEERRGSFGSNPLDKHSLSKQRGSGTLYTDWELADLTDSDGSGIPNRIEMLYGLNPQNPQDDLHGDLDGDGTPNLQAWLAGRALRGIISPLDRDGDSITDIQEDHWGRRNPGLMSRFNPDDAVADPDGDDLMNWQEILIGSDPGRARSEHYHGHHYHAGLPLSVNDRVVFHWLLLTERLQDIFHERLRAALHQSLPEALQDRIPLWQNQLTSWQWIEYGPDEDGNPIVDENGSTGYSAPVAAPGLVQFLADVPPTLHQPRRAARPASAPPDYDGDGMPDTWEWRHRLNHEGRGLDPLNPADAGPASGILPLPDALDTSGYFDEDGNGIDASGLQAAQESHSEYLQAFWSERLHIDPDNDRLSNRFEFSLGSHPLIADSDGDGTPDGIEVLEGSNPASAASIPGIVLQAESGGAQQGFIGQRLPSALAVRALRIGQAVPNLPLQAVIIQGGGLLAAAVDAAPQPGPLQLLTDSSGCAHIYLTLPEAPGPVLLRVTAPGGANNSAEFTATALPPPLGVPPPAATARTPTPATPPPGADTTFRYLGRSRRVYVEKTAGSGTGSIAAGMYVIEAPGPNNFSKKGLFEVEEVQYFATQEDLEAFMESATEDLDWGGALAGAYLDTSSRAFYPGAFGRPDSGAALAVTLGRRYDASAAAIYGAGWKTDTQGMDTILMSLEGTRQAIVAGGYYGSLSTVCGQLMALVHQQSADSLERQLPANPDNPYFTYELDPADGVFSEAQILWAAATLPVSPEESPPPNGGGNDDDDGATSTPGYYQAKFLHGEWHDYWMARAVTGQPLPRLEKTWLRVTERTHDTTGTALPNGAAEILKVDTVTLVMPEHALVSTQTLINGTVPTYLNASEMDVQAPPGVIRLTVNEIGVKQRLLPVEVDYIAHNPTTGAFENLGGVIPESRPTPDVNIQVGSVQLTGNGGVQFTVSGTVTDPLAGLLQGSGPQAAKILFDGQVIETVSLSGGSGGTTPVWQPHANQSSFSRTITIPTVRVGPHVVRVHTSPNSANEVGWDQATIIVRKSGIPFNGQTPSAANQPPSAYPGYLPVTIAFSGALSSTGADAISLTQDGTAAVTLSEPATAPAALTFSGSSAALQAFVELDSAPSLNPAQIDVLQATAEITLASGAVARMTGIWTETGANTKVFAPSSFRYLADANPVAQLVVDSVQHTTKQHTGSLTPFVVRISVPESMADTLTQPNGTLSITVGGQQATVVRDDAFNVGGVQSSGMASLFLAKDNKPQVFGAVEERQGDLLPPGVFQAGGFAVGLKQQGGDDMPLSEAAILQEDDPPTGTASGAEIPSASQPYDLAEVIRWLAVLDEIGQGNLMALLEAFQSLGQEDFTLELADLWDLFHWNGYQLIHTDQRHENADLPFTIRIDDDFPSAVHAAQALAEALLDARLKVWRGRYNNLEYPGTGGPVFDYAAMIERMGLALDNAATAAQIGLSLLNEGADWVLTVPEIVDSIQDGKHKQAAILGAAMVIPFVAGVIVKKGIGLKIRSSTGEYIELPDEVLEAFAAARAVAKNADSAAASRLEAMKVLGPLLQSGQVSRELMEGLIDRGFFFVSNSSSRGFLRKALELDNFPNSIAHHDLPIAKEFNKNFLLAGLDPNDPAFGRIVNKATHDGWHNSKDVARGGAFNWVWRQFFAQYPEATAQQILDKLAEIRSGHVYRVPVANGQLKDFGFSQ